MKKTVNSAHRTYFKAEVDDLVADVRSGARQALEQVAAYFNNTVEFRKKHAKYVVARLHHQGSWKALLGKDDWLRCSFCRKWQYQVRMLINGPGVHICNDCIELGRRLIDKGDIPERDEDAGARGNAQVA